VVVLAVIEPPGWMTSHTSMPQDRLVFTMPPQIRRASQSRS
jgi:hypothetical protein